MGPHGGWGPGRAMCGCRGHGGALPPEPVPRPRGGVWPLQGPLCSLRSQLCVNKDATCSTGGAPCPGSAGECPAPAPLCLLSVCALAPAQSWLHTGNVSGTGPARVPLTVGAGRTCPWSLSVSQGVGQRWWAGPLCIPLSGGLVWAESHPEAGVHGPGRAGWCSQAGDGGGLGAWGQPGGPAGVGQGAEAAVRCRWGCGGPPPRASWGGRVGLERPEPSVPGATGAGRPWAQRAGEGSCCRGSAARPARLCGRRPG